MVSDLFDNAISIISLSAGERISLSKILYLYMNNYKNKLILVDSPELMIHPSNHANIMGIYKKFAEENNCKIIMATNSPLFISESINTYEVKKCTENNLLSVIELKNNFLDRDVNAILRVMMGTNYFPKFLTKLHKKYRDIINKEGTNYSEAKEIKNEILKYESLDSSFFQDINFETELGIITQEKK